MFEKKIKKFLAIVMAVVYVNVFIVPASLAETLSASDTESVVRAFNNAATSGFVDYEEYKKFNSVFNKYSGRDFKEAPLTDAEISELEKLVNDLRNTIPNWMQRLIQSAKELESDGLVTFNNPDWEILSKECLNVGSSVESQVPLDEFIAILEKMKSGKEFDWKVFEKDLNRDYGDCQRHIEGIVRDVSKAKRSLIQELDVLAEKIQKKEAECQSTGEQDRAKCNEQLDDLYQEFEDKEEKVTKLEKFENESMKLKALLGFLAIIAGVVIGVYCCPELGASIAAWGGKTLEENQHYTEKRPVTETRKTGRKRVLDGAKGDVTEDEIKALDDKLEKKGFKKVPVEDKTPGKIAYEIYQSEEELRVYLVKGERLVAKVNSVNVDVKNNNRNVVRLGSVVVGRINGDIFIDDNLVKLNVEGKGPDGKEIKVSIVETSVGANRFTLIVE